MSKDLVQLQNPHPISIFRKAFNFSWSLVVSFLKGITFGLMFTPAYDLLGWLVLPYLRAMLKKKWF